MPETRVRLRPVAEADLPDYVRWLNDPEVTQWLQRDPGLTLEQEREWFRQITAPDFGEVVRAIEAEGRHIGNCGLSLRKDSPTAYFGISIGDRSAWGKGYGTAATREMLRIGFEERGLHRIYLDTWAHNVRAQRCYEKCGFRYEGLRRKAILKSGVWLDVVMMAILREEWEARRDAAEPGPGEVRLRGYRDSDYEQVIALWRAAGFHPGAGDTREALRYRIVHNCGPSLVAELDGQIVGSAMGTWDGRRAWVNRVAVHPDQRRRGIGRRLMDEVERRLAALGARKLLLDTGRDSLSGQAFYASCGYQLADHVVLMYKELTGEECS